MHTKEKLAEVEIFVNDSVNWDGKAERLVMRDIKDRTPRRACGCNNAKINFNAAGTNLQGGQNRVQMAISDVNARQGFSRAGGAGTFSLTPNAVGYGKGNALLTAGSTSGLGTPGGRQHPASRCLRSST